MQSILQRVPSQIGENSPISGLRVAIFNDAFGQHPYGGPSILAHNLLRMLAEHTDIDFTLFYAKEPHPNYIAHPEHLKPYSEFEACARDFDIFYVQCGVRLAQELNRMGITPILGSNLVPNSAPLHCLPFLDDKGRTLQAQFVALEQQLVHTLRGKFWLAQSKFQEREYRRLGLPWEVPVYYAPNPVDTELFKPPEERGEAICWVGKANWAKAPRFLRVLAGRFPNEKFLCLSDEPMPGSEANIEHQGGMNKDMPRLLSQCKIFLSTSVTENQPLGILEAMAMGLPVIAFRTSGIPEIVREWETGLLVDLGNLDHFAVELERLLRDEELCSTLGEAAREYVVRNFSYEAVVPIYKGIFELAAR
jgi:glycosyltransferase involved in cell wall biosynthesis